MTHFFEKRDRWGNGLALWVLAGVVFLAPLACWSLKQIRLKNDIETWLPQDDPHRQLLGWYIDQFHREDRLLLSWDGSTLRDPRIDRLAKRLEGTLDADGIRRHGLKQILRVNTPSAVIRRMADNGIEPAEALRRLQGVLVGTGPLKVELTDIGRTRKKSVIRSLVACARQELGLDIQVLEPVSEWIPPDGFFAEEPLVTDDESGNRDEVELPPVPNHDFQIAAPGLRVGSKTATDLIRLAESLRGEATAEAPDGIALVARCFLAPGSPVGISVTLSEAGVADVEGTVAAIRQAAQDVGIPKESLRLGGRPVARSALNLAVLDAVWNANLPASQWYKRSIVLLSALIGTVLAFVLLRSISLTLMILAVTYYTIFITLSIVPVTGGSMNMVLIVMPTLLMVLTISAGIHLANYWKHASQTDSKSAVVTATRMARLPCTMASLTTAIGLLSLLTSSLKPVRDFGIYSAIGCLISLVMVLFGLPALIQIGNPRVTKAAQVNRSAWHALGTWLAKVRYPVIAGSGIVFAVACAGLIWFQTETKAIRYFPEHSRIVQDYLFLEGNLANIVPVELLVRFDKSEQDRLNFLERLEVVRTIEEQMREHPEISGTVSLADFVEKTNPLPEKASRVQKLLATRRANEVEKRIREGEETGARSFLTFVNEDAEFQFDPGRNFSVQEGDEIWRVTAQVAIMSDYDYAGLANDRQTGDLDEIAKASLKYHPGASHVVTGMVPVFLRTQQAVLHSLIKSFALAFAVIAVVMMLLLRHPIAGLLAMLPNLMPVGVVFGLLAWSGIAVDIGTMITASVALGIAVDGTLHLITWFRDGIANGLTRDEAVAEALSQCGPALWQTTLVIGLAMVVLFPAELLLVSRFGWLMAALIGSAFVADALLLSAFLAGPLGAILERVSSAKQTHAPDNHPPAQEVAAA